MAEPRTALERFEFLVPFVEWREPLRIETTDGEWCLACRVCIALHGFQARSVADWPRTREEWDEHFAEHVDE